MKRLNGTTLVVSDVHGNLPALEAVLALPHDHVICLGDTIGRGPQPLECLARLRDDDTTMILGNHEFGLLQSIGAASGRDESPTFPAEMLDFLNSLPRWLRIGLEFGTCLCVHGSPRSILGRGMGADAAAWRGQLATSVPVDAVFVGHTHIPYDLSVDGTRVVNPGSVGLPQDGDPRAACAVVEGDTIRLKRVPYAIEQTIAAIERAKMPPERARSFIAWVQHGVREADSQGSAGSAATSGGDSSIDIHRV